MAAVKRLLMDILDDLEIDDAYGPDGELDPRVRREWERRIAKSEQE